MSGVGHGGGDTQFPGVIAGVLKTDAIWSREGKGWDWAGHTLCLQHLSPFGDISRATLSQTLGICPSGSVPPRPATPPPLTQPRSPKPVWLRSVLSFLSQVQVLDLPPSSDIKITFWVRIRQGTGGKVLFRTLFPRIRVGVFFCKVNFWSIV